MKLFRGNSTPYLGNEFIVVEPSHEYRQQIYGFSVIKTSSPLIPSAESDENEAVGDVAWPSSGEINMKGFHF